MAEEAGDMEDEVTWEEALEAQEFQENQSVAVLGASDPNKCSYSQGYMKRQALYACLTCNPKGAPFSQAAGVCLACSYTCHDGHDLVELFTKRHFRCDCGNTKFPDNPCRLQSGKDDTNPENSYNQNYDGVYCSCHRPYPDPDRENEVSDDPMYQCIICEDWYHCKHCVAYLNNDLGNTDEEFELICGPCMGKLDFLGHYAHLALKPAPVIDESACNDSSASTVQVEADVENGEVEVVKSAGTQVDDTTSQDSGVASLTGSDSSSDTTICHLKKRTKESLPFSDVQAIFWKDTLRSSLCRCSKCMEMYEKLKILFLLDTEDTIEHYEAVGRKKIEDARRSAEASIDNQVNSLDRVGQLELMHGVNFFKDQLAEFLKEHAESGTTVRREDVVNFFEKINEVAAKRRRLE